MDTDQAGMKDSPRAKIKNPLVPQVEGVTEPARPDAIAVGGGCPLKRFAGFACLLVLGYSWVLVSLARYAMSAELHSHILLIPFVSCYLIYINRGRMPRDYHSSPGWALVPALVALVSLTVALALGRGDGSLSRNDFFALAVFSFLCFLVAGGLFFLGKKWMASVIFPVAVLFFMAPLPDRAVNLFETGLMIASAEASELFFSISGIPYLRDGQIFQLPGITLEVAQECSGIRSSWVLFITSLLASYGILRSPWRRIFLVAVVIPLGILRNGFRVLVIGLLCVGYGPHMIDSIIHRRGGPLFFALSLIPLFLLIWLLRRGEGPEEDRAE